MVEAVVSITIVGVMLVAALNAVGAARTGTRTIGDRARGALLAQQLMAEIMQCAYEDPVAGSLVLGPDGVQAPGSRSGFDDVDDYNGWSEGPPVNRAGSPLAGYENWERTVTVEFVDPDDLKTAVLSNSGVKRIIVTVRWQGRTVAVWTAIRCSSGAPGTMG